MKCRITEGRITGGKILRAVSDFSLNGVQVQLTWGRNTSDSIIYINISRLVQFCVVSEALPCQ